MNNHNATAVVQDDCIFIRAQIDVDAARCRLTRRSGWRTRAAGRFVLRVLGRRRRDDGPRHVELVWLPHYHVVFQSRTSDDELVTIDMLIDGSDRRATFWDLASVQWEPGVDRECFQPAFDEEDAREIARRALFEAGLRGKSWRHGLKTWEIRRIRVVHYPYWVAYFERHNERLDVDLVDAVTAELAGPAAKIALLAALARANHATARNSADGNDNDQADASNQNAEDPEGNAEMQR